MLKTILITLFALAGGTVAAEAQSLEAFKNHLSRPVTDGKTTARVEVCEVGSAAAMVKAARTHGHRNIVKGYRVCIYADNGSDARAEAVAAKQLFEETFPGIKVYMVYENPYFRVTVGNCMTAEDAIILKGRVAATFPKAFPKSEDLHLSDFVL